MRSLDNLKQYINILVDLGRMNRWSCGCKTIGAILGCTALLAQNDETAIGVMQALEDAGIKVPEQVSVVGFDDIEMALFVRPNLTTVHVPLCSRSEPPAAAMLIEPEQRVDSVVLPVDLIVRATTMAPAKN